MDTTCKPSERRGKKEERIESCEQGNGDVIRIARIFSGQVKNGGFVLQVPNANGRFIRLHSVEG